MEICKAKNGQDMRQYAQTIAKHASTCTINFILKNKIITNYRYKQKCQLIFYLFDKKKYILKMNTNCCLALKSITTSLKLLYNSVPKLKHGCFW